MQGASLCLAVARNRLQALTEVRSWLPLTTAPSTRQPTLLMCLGAQLSACVGTTTYCHHPADQVVQLPPLHLVAPRHTSQLRSALPLPQPVDYRYPLPPTCLYPLPRLYQQHLLYLLPPLPCLLSLPALGLNR